jgi:hypothetical protein
MSSGRLGVLKGAVSSPVRRTEAMPSGPETKSMTRRAIAYRSARRASVRGGELGLDTAQRPQHITARGRLQLRPTLAVEVVQADTHGAKRLRETAERPIASGAHPGPPPGDTDPANRLPLGQLSE